MKKMIMIMFALIFTIVLGVNAKDENEKLSFNKVLVEAPCRIITTLAPDTTMINIRNNSYYDLYYEIEDDVLYIRPNRKLTESDYYYDDVPTVRIIADKLPIFNVSNTLTIIENTIFNKKNGKDNDVASNN